jgi:hypothetical protein
VCYSEEKKVRSISDVSTPRLRNLIEQLKSIDKGLKEDLSVEEPVLLDLRHALDSLRMTAWTVSELQNARKAQKDTRALASFLSAERLRRIRAMIDDLTLDLERDGMSNSLSTSESLTWSAEAVKGWCRSQSWNALASTTALITWGIH